MKELEQYLKDKKHLIFLDFEGTQFSHEMIAIGAVRVDINNKTKRVKRVFPPFKQYVLSRETIGPIVVELTGITDEFLHIHGLEFKNVQAQLKKYIHLDYSKCVFVTFGSHDIRILNQTFQHNMKANKLEVKTICANHFDMSNFLSNYIKDEHGNPLSLQNYLKVFNVVPEGIPHDPSYDAINLFKLYEAMLTNAPILEEHYIQLLKKQTNYPYPIQQILNDIFKGQKVDQNTLYNKVREYIEND